MGTWFLRKRAMEKIHGNPMGSAGKAYENTWKTWEKPMEVWKTMKLLKIQWNTYGNIGKLHEHHGKRMETW